MNFEHPLTSSGVADQLVFRSSPHMLRRPCLITQLGGWQHVVEAVDHHQLRHGWPGALIPEFTKVFTSVNSRHVREIVDASREGGPASLTVLSGPDGRQLQRAYWLGLVHRVAVGCCVWGEHYWLWDRSWAWTC